jgi:hypothetical protein
MVIPPTGYSDREQENGQRKHKSPHFTSFYEADTHS